MEESDIAAWTVGSGIVLIQACAIVPGLLPCLLLVLPLVLPLIVLGALAAIPFAIARAVRKVF
jgi:hypothetical protein